MAEYTVLTEITLDFARQDYTSVVRTKQYDNLAQGIQVNFLVNSISYELESGYVARIRGTRPDGKGFYNNAEAGEAGDTCARFAIISAMTEVAGRIPCDVELSDGSGRVIKTATFILDVRESALQADAEEGTSAYQPLEAALANAEATTNTAGLMSAKDKAKLDGIDEGANNYTLPAATGSTLGGVIIGSNITNSNGKISVAKSNVTSALGYTPATSSHTHDYLPTSGGTVSGSVTLEGAVTAKAGVEIYHTTPYIDFHYGNSSEDYTSRVIENAKGVLTVSGGLALNNRTESIGTVTSSSTLLNSSVGTSVTNLVTVTLTAGTYVINGQVVWKSVSSARTCTSSLALSTTMSNDCCQTTYCPASNTCRQNLTRIFTTSGTTIYLAALCTTTNEITAAQINAVRIA